MINRVVELNDIKSFTTSVMPKYKELKILYERGFILNQVDDRGYTFSRNIEDEGITGHLKIYDDSAVKAIEFNFKKYQIINDYLNDWRGIYLGNKND